MVNLFQTIGVSDSLNDIQLKRIADNLFEVSSSSGSWLIEVLETDFQTKKIRIRYNHRTYWIQFQDELDLVLERMGLNAADQNGSLSLKAPMPGRILEILAKKGDQINEGSSLLVLEAMKMENVLKADSDGIIENVLVEKDQNVDKNQILIEIKSL
jgi:biotin carboxyl carrier protein